METTIADSYGTKEGSTVTECKPKTIVLIRHAQSTENVKVIRACECLTRLGNLLPPTCDQFTSTLSLLSLTIDSAVSVVGKSQIADMHAILEREKFWSQHNFDLVLCSPLTRARETCAGMLPGLGDDKNVMILDDLEEATPFEHVFSATLIERIERFKVWLGGRKEQNIAIFGHSQYFKKMLGLSTLMRNCDVWQCSFTSRTENLNTDNTCQPVITYNWSDLGLLHRTELSEKHPYDKMINGDGDEVFNELHEDKPFASTPKVWYKTNERTLIVVLILFYKHTLLF